MPADPLADPLTAQLILSPVRKRQKAAADDDDDDLVCICCGSPEEGSSMALCEACNAPWHLSCRKVCQLAAK